MTITLKNLSVDLACFFISQLMALGNDLQASIRAVRWLDGVRGDVRMQQIERWQLSLPKVADPVDVDEDG